MLSAWYQHLAGVEVYNRGARESLGNNSRAPCHMKITQQRDLLGHGLDDDRTTTQNSDYSISIIRAAAADKRNNSRVCGLGWAGLG